MSEQKFDPTKPVSHALDDGTRIVVKGFAKLPEPKYFGGVEYQYKARVVDKRGIESSVLFTEQGQSGPFGSYQLVNVPPAPVNWEEPIQRRDGTGKVEHLCSLKRSGSWRESVYSELIKQTNQDGTEDAYLVRADGHRFDNTREDNCDIINVPNPVKAVSVAVGWHPEHGYAVVHYGDKVKIHCTALGEFNYDGACQAVENGWELTPCSGLKVRQ